MQKSNIEKLKSSGALSVLIISIKLVIVCSIVAVLVSVVNFLTEKPIYMNRQREIAAALSSIYVTDGLTFSAANDGRFLLNDKDGNSVGTCEGIGSDAVLLKDIDAVYKIKRNDGSLFGYCVEASPLGFNDDIGILVAISPSNTVREVKIVHFEDTAGIGDKIKQNSFLKKFIGETAGFSANSQKYENMVIAGATKSSGPVITAVNTALLQTAQLSEIPVTNSGGAAK